jgi:hypothetical protein
MTANRMGNTERIGELKKPGRIPENTQYNNLYQNSYEIVPE